ncbi:ATP-dependent RNA helicase dbp5 [Obelidium mucronatum]|nr:ATP-dependent RNA helicase dbp5 [Obelidium mucronatum]
MTNPTSPIDSGWGAPPKTTDLSGMKSGWGVASPTSPSQVDRVANQVAELSAQDEKPQPKHTRLPGAGGEGGDGHDANSPDKIVVTLSDGTVDPTLYNGVRSFEDLGLSQELLKGIYERALPMLLSDPPENMVGQSQSGTGKTAAFVLTMLSRIDFSNPALQALCLAPSQMGKYTGVTTAFAIKDLEVPRNTKIHAQLIVGTPGTVMDFARKNMIDTKQVKVFVLDEADNMLDLQGLGDQSLRNFAQRVAPNARAITLKREELSVDAIKQLYMDCRDEAHKTEILMAIYGLLTIGQSIIFVRVSCLFFSSSLDGAQRDKVIDEFREGKSKVLITTNVLSRGIDILQVNLVINFDMPLHVDGVSVDPETYLHRIGRTGRFGRTGVSINFVHDAKSFREMDAIQKHFGREIVRVGTESYDEIERMLKKAIK